jgi:hypothetical protein
MTSMAEKLPPGHGEAALTQLTRNGTADYKKKRRINMTQMKPVNKWKREA